MKAILSILALLLCAATVQATECVQAFCGGVQQVVVQRQVVGGYGVQQVVQPVYAQPFVQRQVVVRQRFVQPVVVQQPVIVRRRAFVASPFFVSPFVARPFFAFGF